MRTLRPYAVGTVLLIFGLVTSPALAQQEPNNDGEIPQETNPQSECDAVAAEEGLGSLTAFAKFENPADNGGWDSELPGDDDEITFDPAPPTVPSGSWESTVSIKVFILKQATTLYYWLNPGTSLDYVAPVSDYSHFTFCTIETEDECDLPILVGEDIIDEENRTLTNTMQDDEGIKEFSFSTLDNFTVASITHNGSGSFTRTNDTWTWDFTGDPPTEVTFVLQAGPDGSATYFLEVTDNCEDENTVTFDPTYDFKRVTQPSLQVTGPNPFSAQTTLEYGLTQQSLVTVSVYDMMGRKVSTLVNGQRPTGTHTVTWDGRSDDGRTLASGVYMMRMQAGDRAVTRRVTLVR